MKTCAAFIWAKISALSERLLHCGICDPLTVGPIRSQIRQMRERRPVFRMMLGSQKGLGFVQPAKSMARKSASFPKNLTAQQPQHDLLRKGQ